MDTAEILIHDSTHPFAWSVLLVSLGIAAVCITSRFVPKRGKHVDVIAVPITYSILVFTLIAALLSGGYTAIQAQYDAATKSRVEVATISKTLQSTYSVTRIDGGDPKTGSSLDADDVSNNTYTAQSITIDDRAYQRCQAVISPSTERGKKTYTTMKLTCHNQAEPQKPITITPHK